MVYSIGNNTSAIITEMNFGFNQFATVNCITKLE